MNCNIDTGILIGLVAAVGAFLLWALSKIDSDIKSLGTKIDSLEERMFWMATGKKLHDAILEERMKKQEPKTDP